MKIIKKDLILYKKKHGFSHSDFLSISSHKGHDLDKNSYTVYLGNWQIATIVECNDGRYLLSNRTYNSFKSFDGAIKGLLRRINYNSK